jgi:serine phosphatase RsbU (regulator of sigma subunit)
MGKMDLREWDFEQYGSIALDGEWDFYWQQFIKSDTSKEPKKTSAVFVPSTWNHYQIQNKFLPGKGYASYQVLIELSPNHPEELSLKFLSFGTAYRAYCNGKLVAEVGKIGKTRAEMEPYSLPIVTNIPKAVDQLEIILEVSNFYDKTGGFWHSIELGKTQEILVSRDRTIAVDLLIAGGFLIMAIFHLGIYLLRRKDRSALYFSLVSIFFGLHTLISDERYLLHLFPFLPWELIFRLEYLTVYAGFPLYLMFFQSLYTQEFSKKLLWVTQVICFSMTAFVLFAPPYVFSETMDYMQILMLLIGIYVIYALSLAAVRRRDAARTFLVGLLLFFITVTNDILHEIHWIHSGYYASYGLLFFIFIQSFVLSIRLAKSFLLVEELSENLEDKVNERTAEISKQNQELEKQRDEISYQHDEITQQHDEITKQHDEITKQHEIIEKKNQNITASINYASRIQQAILGSQEAITSNFEDSFILLKPKDIVSGDFYWYTEVKRSSSNIQGFDHRTLFFKVIVAADCTGHGIPGAFMTVLGNTLLDEIINENRITNPGKILSLLDRKLLMKLQKQNVNDGMDISMLIFDDENKKVSFSGANNPLYHVRKGEITAIAGSKFPIGSTQYTKKKFDTHTIDYEEGDVFYICSDGFQDQFGGDENRKYYKKQFREFLLSIAELPMAAQKQCLENEFLKWKGHHSQTDDILIIGIRT